MLVVPEWPNSPWYPTLRSLLLRSIHFHKPCFLDDDGNLRPTPKWGVRVGILDGHLVPPPLTTSLPFSDSFWELLAQPPSFSSSLLTASPSAATPVDSADSPPERVPPAGDPPLPLDLVPTPSFPPLSLLDVLTIPSIVHPNPQVPLLPANHSPLTPPNISLAPPPSLFSSLSSLLWK